MAARKSRPTRMSAVRRGWAVAASEAVLSGATVAFIAWYAVARSEAFRAWLEPLPPSREGLVTLFVVLLAGGLLAHAFGRAEDAVRGLRSAHHDSSGADD